MNFLVLGFVDTSNFTAALLTRHRAHIPKITDSLPLRTNEEDHEVLKDWKSAKALFARMKTAMKPHLNDAPPIIVNAFVHFLQPEEGTAWSASTEAGVWRTRTCLIPSPGAFTFVGAESALLPVGQVTAVDHTALGSDINIGPCMRAHLVVDFLRAEPADDDQD